MSIPEPSARHDRVSLGAMALTIESLDAGVQLERCRLSDGSGDGILRIVEEDPRVVADHTTEQALAGEHPKMRSGGPHGSFLPDVTGVNFPVARRGYDRKRVDHYVERVSSIVVELESRGLSRNSGRERAVRPGLVNESPPEASGSPDAVIERALADVGEETSAILRRALAAAEEIVDEANMEAKQLAARVEGETQQTREEADCYREQATLDADKIVSQTNSEAAQAEAVAHRTREEANQYAERVKDEAEEVLAQAYSEAERLTRERRRLTEGLRNLADDFRRTADALAPDPDRSHQGSDSDSDSAAGR